MAKLAKKKNESNYTNVPELILSKLTDLYIFFLLAVYPLYYENKYYNMGEAKWTFFKNVTVLAAVLVGVVFAWYICEFARKNELVNAIVKAVKESSLTDKFVFAYLIVCMISTLLATDRSLAMKGYKGWYMGFMAQLCFVLIYLFVSRLWRWDPVALVVYLASGFIVFFFGVIMRFGVDPMEMYLDLNDMYKLNFLSTLGQATWYSSYMCIIFPLGLFGFWYYDGKVKRALLGLFTAVGFMTMVTQNSDSAYIAFAAIFFLLFWISLENNRYFERLLECLVICFASFVFMGILQVALSDRATKLDSISTFMSQSIFTKLMLVIAVAACAGFKYLIRRNDKIDIAKIKPVRVVLLVLILIAAVAVVIYIVLNTAGALPENLASDNNYLLFDEFWGNNRGSSWTCAVGTFIQCSPLRKLIGAGPDCFARLVYEFYGETLHEKWGATTMLTCAHNEWLNTIINLGIFGFVTYVGIFVTSFVSCMKKAKEYPELYAVAISIAAYMCHNFFCYQQIICTPVIFILMGGAAAISRRGYVREDV